MDNFNGYNIGSGLVDITATSVSTDTLITDDINSQSGIINLNLSTLSNVNDVYCDVLSNNTIYCSVLSNNTIYCNTLSNSQNLSVGGITTLNNTTYLSNTYLQNNGLYLRVGGDTNHGIVYNATVDGPRVMGYGGGVLGTTATGTVNALYWNYQGNVGIGTTVNSSYRLAINGDAYCSSNILASNLATSNLIIYRGSNVLDTDGKIDYSWIKNAPIQTSNDGTIIIAPVVITNIINNVITNVQTQTGGNGDETYDPANNSSNIYVHWRNVIYQPLYCRTRTDEQVAFGSNVFIEKNSKIYGVDAVDLIKTDAGRTRRLDTNLLNPIVFYDFSNQEMFLKVINCNSNINASNIITSNIIANTITSSNLTSSNINASNISTASFTATNLFSCNIVSSNCFSSNIINTNLWSSNVSSSNITSCNYYGVISYSSNIITSNVSSSNVSTSNLSTNLLQATSVNSQTSIITTMIATTLSASNITACNLIAFSNDYYTFSNLSWKFNDSNIYHGLNEKVIAIGKSNATEKLDIQGNIKVSGGGSFANNNFVISSNTSNVHCLTINNSNIFRTDGTIGNHFLTQLNILAGNSNFAGTIGDIYNPQSQSSNLLTNWNAVIWKPLYQDNNYNLGFSSNVYFNRFSQLCTTEPSWDYTKTSNGLYKTFNAPFVRSNVVIDFSNYTATLCNILTSNATVSNNLITSNLTSSNITSSNLTSLNANLSNLWASNVGINQVNPLYNLDVNGGARIQRDLFVNSNLTVGTNLGVGTTSPAYKLDVNGTTAIRNGNGNVSWTNNQLLFGYNNTNTYQHAINTRHDGGGGNKNSIDFLLWNSNVSSATVGNTNTMSITATGVGIFNSNPSYKLDVNGNVRLNNAFIGDVGYGSAYAGFSHCNFAGNSYAFLQANTGQTFVNCATSQTINFRVNNADTMVMGANNLGIQSTNTIEFGQGVSGKDTSAGKIGYQTFTSGSLDIVGAGTTAGSRNIKLWEDVLVARNLSVASNANIAVNLTASNIGIGTSSPSYPLDISGYGMRLQGGASLTNPTVFYLNSTGAGSTTSQIRFVNSGHHITCTDCNLWNGIDNVGGGHNIYYQSGGHNFSGTTRFDYMQVRSSSTLEFGQGVSGKETSAGKVGYQAFTTGALDIVGAGTASGSRKVKLWDNVEIPGTLTVGTRSVFGQKIVNYSVGMGVDGLNTYTITHNLGTSSYNVFFSNEDTTTPVVDDTFLIKVLSKGTNTCDIGIMRRTGAYWNRSWNLVCMFVMS
jgi:hypothetical protein